MKNNYKKQLKITAISMMMLVLLLFPVTLLKAQIATTAAASRCGEGQLVLRATATSGTIKWYTTPFYGDAIVTGVSGNGTTFTTPSQIVTTAYYVDAVDGANCSLNTNRVRVPVLATISSNSIQAIIFYASNTFCRSISGAQSVTRTGTEGGIYSYTRTSGAGSLTLSTSTGDITPSSSAVGTYIVTYTVTAAEGCVESPASTTVYITDASEAPTIAYSGSPLCTSAGSVTVTQTGATGGSYSAVPSGLAIDPGTGTIAKSTSLTGEYTITYFVTSAGGCAPQTTTTTMTILQLPTASISYASPFCNSDVSQSVSLTGTGVYTGGHFTKTAGAGTLSLDEHSGAVTPSGSDAGIYTISYTLSAVSPCAEVVVTTNVTIYPLPTATLTGSVSICRGTSTNLSIAFTGTSPWSFTYTDGETPVTVTNNTDNPKTISVNPTATTTYSLTRVSDAHCTGTTSGTAVITVGEQPAADFSYTGTPYCSNGVNPFPSYTGGGIAGSFTSSDAALKFVDASTGVINLSTSAAGTYTVTNTVTVPTGCTTEYHDATVTITKLPVATFTYAQSAYCINGADPSATIPAGSTAGTFSSTTGLVFLNASTGAIDLSACSAGVYVVTNTIAAATGCELVTATYNLTINPPPSLTSIIYEAASYCQSSPNQSVTLSGDIGGTYTATTGLSINASTGEINPSTSTAGGPYTVTYTIASAGGCSALTATFNITILAAPTATISYAGSPFCKSLGSGQAVSLTGTSGGTYTSTTGLALVGGTGAIDPSSSTAGEYTITYTIAAAGGCSEFITTTAVTITTLPVVTSIAYSKEAYCMNEDVQAVTLNGTGGGTYTSTTSGLAIDAGSGLITPGTSTAGSYTVTYTVAAGGGCAAIPQTTSVTIYTPPTPVISGTQTLCIGSSGIVYSTPNVAGHTYVWYVDGGTVTEGAGTNSVTVTWTAPVGSLIVTEAITATGCSVATEPYTVMLNFLPTATISGTTTLCQNASSPVVTFKGSIGTKPYTFTYTINGGEHLTVTTPETDTLVTVSQATGTAGTYIYALVSVQDASSTHCSQARTGSATITVNPLPNITSDGIAVAVGYSASAQTTTLAYTASANSPVSYSIAWTGLAAQASTTNTFASGAGAVSGIVIPALTASGTYTGTITFLNANTCSDTHAISVTVKEISAAPEIVSITATTTTTGAEPVITDEIVSGTSEASAVITIYKNAVLTAFTTTAAAGGTWSVTVSGLVATDVITAKATAPSKWVSAASTSVTIPAAPTGTASQSFCSGGGI